MNKQRQKSPITLRSGKSQARLGRLPFNWAIAGFLIGILLAVGIVLRLEMLRDRSGIEGQYAVNVQYGPWYLANEGRLFAVTGELPAISNYTSGLNYGAVDFTTTFLHGAVLSLSGTRDPAAIGQSYFMFPWQGLILIPLAFCALYSRFCRICGRDTIAYHYVLIYALAAFGQYSMVSWSISGGVLVPYGWLLYIVIYLALLMRAVDSEQPMEWVIVFVVAALLMQATYHTMALALFLLIGFVFLLQRVLTNWTIVQGNTTLLIAIAFLGFLTYHAVTFLNDYGRLGRHFLRDIFRSQDKAVFDYYLRLDPFLSRLQFVNYAVVALPSMCVVGLVIHNRRKLGLLLSYHLLWLLWLIPMAVLFFAWGGFGGAYARLLQFGTLLSIAAAALLLAFRQRLLHGLVTCVALVSTLVTVYSVPAGNVGSATLLTEDEYVAMKWYATRTGCDAVLFTDFRIGPALGYTGCFAVIGPTSSSLAAKGMVQVIEDLYYDTTPGKIALAIENFSTTDGQVADYILISQAMTSKETGVYVADGHLKPMFLSTWDAYHVLPGWGAVYQNNTVSILQRTSVAQPVVEHFR